MKEQDRQRAIRVKLARMESRPAAPPVSTGFPELDAALGVGGLPRGRFVELFGASSSGKTTLAFHTVAHLQQAGGTAAWIDAEHAFDARYAAELGVAVERMPMAQPESAEDALEIVRHLVNSRVVDLVVVDSAAALVPQVELDTGMGQGGAGIHSRVLASGLRKLSAAVAKTDTVVLFLNQARTKMEPTGVEIEVSAGGAPLKLFAAVRIALIGGGEAPTRFRVLKNKPSGAFGEGELRWPDRSKLMEGL